jgi:hypothetical protein
MLSIHNYIDELIVNLFHKKNLFFLEYFLDRSVYISIGFILYLTKGIL